MQLSLLARVKEPSEAMRSTSQRGGAEGSVPLCTTPGTQGGAPGTQGGGAEDSVPLCTTLYHSVPRRALTPSAKQSDHQWDTHAISGVIRPSGGVDGWAGGGGRGVTTYLFLWSDGCREDTSLGVLRPSSRGGRLPLGAATNAPTGPALGERGLSPPESVSTTSSSRSNPSNASSMSP
jgi:hypothetical protein